MQRWIPWWEEPGTCAYIPGGKGVSRIHRSYAIAWLNVNFRYILISDNGNGCIRKVDMYTHAAPVLYAVTDVLGRCNTLGSNESTGWTEGTNTTGIGNVASMVVVNFGAVLYFTATHPATGVIHLRKTNWFVLQTIRHLFGSGPPFVATTLLAHPVEDDLLIGSHPERNVLQVVNTTTGIVQVWGGSYHDRSRNFTSLPTNESSPLFRGGHAGIAMDERTGRLVLAIKPRDHLRRLPTAMKAPAMPVNRNEDKYPGQHYANVRAAAVEEVDIFALVCAGNSILSLTTRDGRQLQYTYNNATLDGSGTFQCGGIAYTWDVSRWDRKCLLITNPVTGCLQMALFRKGKMGTNPSEAERLGGATWETVTPAGQCDFTSSLVQKNATHLIAANMQKGCLKYVGWAPDEPIPVTELAGDCTGSSNHENVDGPFASTRFTRIDSLAQLRLGGALFVATDGGSIRKLDTVKEISVTLRFAGNPFGDQPILLTTSTAEQTTHLMISTPSSVIEYNTKSDHITRVIGRLHRQDAKNVTDGPAQQVSASDLLGNSSTPKAAVVSRAGSLIVLDDTRGTNEIYPRTMALLLKNDWQSHYSRTQSSTLKGASMSFYTASFQYLRANATKFVCSSSNSGFLLLENGHLYKKSPHSGSHSLAYDFVVNGSLLWAAFPHVDITMCSNGTHLLVTNKQCIFSLHVMHLVEQRTVDLYGQLPSPEAVEFRRIDATRSSADTFMVVGETFVACWSPGNLTVVLGSVQADPTEPHQGVTAGSSSIGTALSMKFADWREDTMYVSGTWTTQADSSSRSLASRVRPL